MKRSRHTHRLFPQECRVLTLAANGHTSQEIAGILGLSTAAVTGTIERIFNRLGANSRTHAVAIAIKRGEIGLEDIHDAAGELLGRATASDAGQNPPASAPPGERP